MNIVIEYTVAYMLKILKSGRKIDFYEDELNAIKHGNYKDFLKLVNGSIPFIVVYNAGTIRTEENNPNYDCDFEGLVKAGPSLQKFYKECLAHYGEIEDSDVPDEIYYKVVTFEIAIRMHANNFNLLSNRVRTDLIDVINVLCIHNNLSEVEKTKLQNGRVFLNMIKHFKNQFPTWEDGKQHFLLAYEVLEKHQIRIV